MFFVKYDLPLLNNGDHYDFSQEELVKLLDSVYERGYTHGVEVTNISSTTTASYKDGLAVNFTPKDLDHMRNNNNKYDYKENNYELNSNKQTNQPNLTPQTRNHWYHS